MSNRIPTLTNRLHDESLALTARLETLSVDEWQCVVYTENAAWTVKDVLAHLTSAERGFLGLIRNVAAGGSGAPADFDYNAFNLVEVPTYASYSPAETLAAFRAVRAQMIALVAGLSEADLDRVGRHPALGEAPLEAFIKMITTHGKMHLRDVERALRT